MAGAAPAMLPPRRAGYASPSVPLGRSSSSSAGGPAITYCPVSHRPRSTSAQRLEQNGNASGRGVRPQIGQVGLILRAGMRLFVQAPAEFRQSGIGA